MTPVNSFPLWNDGCRSYPQNFGTAFLACVISMPLLAIMFSAVGIIGSWVVAVPLIGLDSGAFWAQMQAGVEVGPDIGNGIIKPLCSA